MKTCGTESGKNGEPSIGCSHQESKVTSRTNCALQMWYGKKKETEKARGGKATKTCSPVTSETL